MRYWLGITIAAALAASADAQGFATKDLSGIGKAAAAALGPGFDMRVQPERLTLVWAACRGEPIVDILVGRQTDGTEERVRSGATGIEDLQRLCRIRSSSCTVSALVVAPAVGWITSYPLGNRAGATAVIIRDGDLLTIRSLAENSVAAQRAINQILPLVRTRIVGH